MSGLSSRRPSSRRARCWQPLAAVAFDLRQLGIVHRTGQIAGRLDGYVRDLRMLDWKPVAFDAWLVA